MEIIRRNSCYRLVGDDRIILGENGDVLSFPIFYELVLFKSLYLKDEHVSGLHEKLKLYTFLKNFKKDKYNLSSIFADRSRLNKVFLAVRNNSIEKVVLEPINMDYLIESIVNSNKMEMIESGISSSLGFVNFICYLQVYSYVFPDSQIAKYWENMLKELKIILKDSTLAYKILLPTEYKKDIFNEILEVL